MLLSLSPFPQDGIIAQIGFLGKIWLALVLYVEKISALPILFQEGMTRAQPGPINIYVGSCTRTTPAPL